MNKIKYTRSTSIYLKELVKALLKNEYFAIESNAGQYTEDIKKFIKSEIGKQQHRNAPVEFKQFGDDLKYISYKRSKRTTWYILFTVMDDYFIIEHITNNHISAQHFGK